MQHNPTQHTNVALMDVFSMMIAIAFPAVAIMAVLSYRKQQVVARQRQIKLLNRIWQIGSSKKLS